MTESSERWQVEKVKYSPTMSDHEALMWHLESDPWFDPSGGGLMIVDRPVDRDAFLRRIRWAAYNAPRLRERVAASPLPMMNPSWELDPEFDIEFHVQRVALPSPGGESELLEMVSNLYQQPFDRTRPLWKIVLIEGLDGDRGAIFVKLHHTIADGAGSMKLAEFYLELAPDDDLPPEVEFESAAPESLGGDKSALPNFLRKVAGEISMWGADPRRALDIGTGMATGASDAVRNVLAGGGEVGSPLMANRSRHRRYHTTQFDLKKAKTASKRLCGTINDFFVTAVAEGTLRYHQEMGETTERLNMSFIVSTRSDGDEAANAFVPARLAIDGDHQPIANRFAEISEAAAELKSEMRSSSASELIGAVAGLAPTAALTRFARQQTASLDIATSNVRAAPFEVYVSGARVLASYPLGPVAGTGANVTVMSYNGTMYVGVLSDPAAITDPELFMSCLDGSIKTLLGARKPAKKKRK